MVSEQVHDHMAISDRKVFDSLMKQMGAKLNSAPWNQYNFGVVQTENKVFLSSIWISIHSKNPFNPIKKIPKEIGSLKFCQAIEIAGGLFSQLPSTIGDLKRLQSLKISEHIKKLPESIGTLENLQVLDLTSNKLKEVPDTIGNLQNLQKLDLSDNPLMSIPESIGNLKNLCILYLPDGVKSLPKSIKNLHNLQQLSFAGKFIGQDREEKEKNRKEIEDFLNSYFK